MSTEFHKNREILTIYDFLKDAIEMHLPPNTYQEERQIKFFGELLELPNAILDTRTDTCCGQSVIFKISQIYPIISVWRCAGALTEALEEEINIMFGIE